MTKRLDDFYALLDAEIERTRSQKEHANNAYSYQYYLGQELALGTAKDIANIILKEVE